MKEWWKRRQGPIVFRNKLFNLFQGSVQNLNYIDTIVNKIWSIGIPFYLQNNTLSIYNVAYILGYIATVRSVGKEFIKK